MGTKKRKTLGRSNGEIDRNNAKRVRERVELERWKARGRENERRRRKEEVERIRQRVEETVGREGSEAECRIGGGNRRTEKRGKEKAESRKKRKRVHGERQGRPQTQAYG